MAARSRKDARAVITLREHYANTCLAGKLAIDSVSLAFRDEAPFDVRILARVDLIKIPNNELHFKLNFVFDVKFLSYSYVLE